jgi:putative nucleotidyltransferase with HDIG domain
MSTAKLHLTSPELLEDPLRSGALNEALSGIAQIAGAKLIIDDYRADTEFDPTRIIPSDREFPILHRGQSFGRIRYRANGHPDVVTQAASAITRLLEHAVDREYAVENLAEEMIASYDELNVLYNLLPSVATKLHADEIADVLVSKAAETLNCARVSLMVLDDDQKNFCVLGSRGLPAAVRNLIIPVSGSIAEKALIEELILVDDIAQQPDLARRSAGQYDTASFAVVRVPLRARSEPLGVITVTERRGTSEFTSRDRKLLEGLSAMGASALLNCRLHASIRKQMMSTILALASAVDAKDNYTHDHSGRVSQFCLAIVRQLGIDDPEAIRVVELAGLLHDIGKIGIPDAILSKPERLTPAEYEIVKTHVSIGAGIVEHIHGLEPVADAILHHHERYDGLGYPNGRAGDDIPLASRLIAIADTFDSLTSDRTYRKGISFAQAKPEIVRCSGSQFDPHLVDAFLIALDTDPRIPR